EGALAMTRLDPQLQRQLDTIATEVVAPQAAAVDREGTLPKASIDRLAAEGLLGLISAREVGGMGKSPGLAALVVERLARECGSTAMVLTMHYAGTTVVEKHGSTETRRAIAAGRHLSTLAFSEIGSRSHFWAPVGTATRGADGRITLNARKSMVTAAG